MLTVHHLGISQSERIVWLCEELGIAYDLRKYDRDPQTGLAPPGYRALHPVGTAPIITDGDLVLPESGAIIEYVINRYGDGRLALPPADPHYADYLFWFHFANGSVMPNEMLNLVVDIAAGDKTSSVVAALTARAATGHALIEQRLGSVPYFAGPRFTAADIIMLFPLSTMRKFSGRDLARFGNTAAYLQRIAARPAYQRAMAKADPGVAPMVD